MEELENLQVIFMENEKKSACKRRKFSHPKIAYHGRYRRKWILD
jgi:hypothetical protein